MKRLILSLTAALLVAGPLPGSVAVAKDKHGGWEQRGGGGGNRGGPERGGPERRGENRGGGNDGWRGGDRGGPDRRIENRGGPGRNGEPRRERRDGGPRWERPNAEPQRAPGGYGVRRGGYMPPNVGAPIEDHNRLRLRTPPRGYSWVRVPGGYALVSEQTGQIFDMVPTR